MNINWNELFFDLDFIWQLFTGGLINLIHGAEKLTVAHN